MRETRLFAMIRMMKIPTRAGINLVSSVILNKCLYSSAFDYIRVGEDCPCKELVDLGNNWELQPAGPNLGPYNIIIQLTAATSNLRICSLILSLGPQAAEAIPRVRECRDCGVATHPAAKKSPSTSASASLGTGPQNRRELRLI